MDYGKFDDDTLMSLIARSQEGALSELYDRYVRLVYSMALNVVSDPAIAEEITQDVFVRIWDNAGVYQAERAKVATWITSVTRHRSIDVLRSLKIRPEAHGVPWDISDPEGERLESNSLNVEEQVEISQKQQRIRKVMSTLPYEQRQALAYAYFQGYSQSEIADLLGEPLGTVKTRIRLAMQKMRQLLEQEVDSDR